MFSPRLFTTSIDSAKVSAVDLVKLRYFRTVAQTLHFRRAAALLGVSQPPLSKSIKNLEDELGTPLLVRTRRHVELTPAGQALLEQSEKIFQELETARIEVKRYGSGQKGLLRIGCEDGTTFTILPPLLQNFQQQYPNVRCSMIAAFAAHLALAGKERLQLRDLRHQPVVALPDDSDNLYTVILPYLKKRRIPVNLVRGAFDLTTLLLMAASGLGVALIPSSYRECGPPSLVYREIIDSTLDLSVGLAWKRGTAKAVVTNFVRVVSGMGGPVHS